jgi:hypothetical protein
MGHRPRRVRREHNFWGFQALYQSLIFEADLAGERQ